MVKTIRTNNQIKLITIPRIPNSTVCPVAVIMTVLDLTSRGSNLPLFQVKVAQEWLPFTNNRISCHFALILDKLNLKEAGFTFHIFHHSGVTFALNNDVTLQNIQKHGIRTSDCMCRFITDTIDAGKQVANMFKDQLSTSKLSLSLLNLTLITLHIVLLS